MEEARGGHLPDLRGEAGFDADSRDEVDRLHGEMVAAGATVLDAPAEYQYTPGYYAVFFADPDGLKLELCFAPAAYQGVPG